MSEAMREVVIVGSGLAGLCAAHGAVHGGARDVLLVSDGEGATACCAGWLGPVRGAALPPVEKLGLRPLGAYRFVTVEGLALDASTGVDELLDVGALGEGTLAVLELGAGSAWQASYVAGSLREQLGRKTVVMRVDDELGAPSLLEAARRLDAHGLVEALGASIARSLRETREPIVAVLLPPVLGLSSERTLATLRGLLKVPFGEAVAQGSPTGFRWMQRMLRGLDARVESARGSATVEVTASGGARVRYGTTALGAKAVVLATGGLYSGGIVYEARLREPCADAPVWLDGGTRASSTVPALSAERGMDPVPLFQTAEGVAPNIARCGVRVNASGRLVGLDGETAMYPWLLGAGAVLAGGEGPYGRSLVESAASGWQAGQWAAELAR